MSTAPADTVRLDLAGDPVGLLKTLIDIASLEPHFERIFGDGGVMREWFNQLVLYSTTITLTGDYVDFIPDTWQMSHAALMAKEKAAITSAASSAKSKKSAMTSATIREKQSRKVV